MAEILSWMAAEQGLTNAALTVRAQALPPSDRDNLINDIFFTPTPVDSVKVSTITGTDFRPVADRREWNTRGRYIPQRTFTQGELEMIPIESYFKIEERETQALVERVLGNQALAREILMSKIPDRVDALVNANRRRMELDAFRAWANGNCVVMNPQTGVATTVSFGFNAARYTTAGTAWNVVASAWDAFLAWVQTGIDLLGGNPEGAVMRLATWNEIKKDAPQGVNAVPRTDSEARGMLVDSLGFPFTIFIVEHSLDTFTDAGLAFTRNKVWPTGKVALVPPGTAVGIMAKAPVARTYELATVARDADIDVRGMSVFREIEGNGRIANFECQINAFPVPIEERIVVIAAGV